MYAAQAQTSRSTVYSDKLTKRSVQSPLSGWPNINPLSYLFALLPKSGLQRADTLSYHTFTSTIRSRGVSHIKTMVYVEGDAQMCHHAILEVRGGITHQHTRHPHSLAPIEQVLSRNLGCASLGWLQRNEFRRIIDYHQDVSKSILFRQILTTLRSAAADIQKIEMDNLSRRSTV